MITEINSGLQPFSHNYFSVSIGLLVVFLLCLVLYALDLEKERGFLYVKLGAILGFLACAFLNFNHRGQPGSVKELFT